MHVQVPSRAAPGPPRGRAALDRRDATRLPNVQDRLTHRLLGSLATKLLTKKSGVRRTGDSDQSPRLKISLAYISWYINGYG
jgi:hypothetical protein